MTVVGCILYLPMKKHFALGISILLLVGLESCSAEQKEINRQTVCVIHQFTNRWYRPSDVAVGRPNPIEIILIRG